MGIEQDQIRRLIAAAHSDQIRLSPTSADIGLSLQRHTYRQELDKRLEGKVWIGPDISNTDEVYIPANGSQIVTVGLPDTFEPFVGMDTYALSLAEITTRSRFAQIGLEVPPGQGPFIGASIAGEEYQSGDGTRYAQVAVRNFAPSPIYLPEQTPFFSFYYWNGRTLEGEALMEEFGKTIQIQGGEDEDWRWWYGEGQSYEKDTVKGIEFFIDQDTARTIRAGQTPLVLDSSAATLHNRHQVDQYVEPLYDSEDSVFWIAELSAHLTLSQGIHGFLNEAATVGRAPSLLDNGEEKNHHRQTNSIVLKGGNTNSNIRVEIISPTKADQMPDTVLVRFARG